MLGQPDKSQAQRELSLLENAGFRTSPDLSQRLEHAQLYRAVHGELKALPLFDDLAAAHPEDEKIAYIPAAIRLEHNDPAGVEPMERLAGAHPRLAASGFRSLARFHERAGNQEESDRLRSLARMAADYDEQAEAESTDIGPDTLLDPPTYSEPQRRALHGAIGDIEGVKRLFAASRYRNLFRDRHHIILFEGEPNVPLQWLGEQIAEIFSFEDFLLLARQDDSEWLVEKLRTIQTAQLYP